MSRLDILSEVGSPPLPGQIAVSSTLSSALRSIISCGMTKVVLVLAELKDLIVYCFVCFFLQEGVN